jgi:hypothetical protein
MWRDRRSEGIGPVGHGPVTASCLANWPRGPHLRAGREQTLRRLIGRAAVVGISDAVAAATRVPDRMVVSRRSGKVGAPGSGAARQIVGWHADRIPPHHSVPRRPGHRLMDASFGLARLVSCRPWHPPPGAGRGQGPLVLNLAGTLAVTTAMVASSTSEDQREPCASAAHRRAPARSGRKSARVRVLGPLTPRPASGRLATARRPASWWTTERRVTCSRARGAAMRPST